jgi:hypothetical protein
MLEFFYFQHLFTYIILVGRDGLAIAAAKRTEQIQESVVLLLLSTFLNDVSNDCIIDLLIKKLLVVVQDFSNGLFGIKVIFICRQQALMEKVGDPLSNIKLVISIVFDAMFQGPVDQSTNSCNRASLSNFFYIIHRILSFKGIDQDVNDQVNDFDLSKILLVELFGKTIRFEWISIFALNHEED